MPFVDSGFMTIYNGISSTPEKIALLYDKNIYQDRRGFVKALRPFRFPMRDGFPRLDWVKYTPATEKMPEKWTILEPELCDVLKEQYHLHYVNGAFYCDDGYKPDDSIRALIAEWIAPFFEARYARTVSSVFETLRTTCYTELPAPDESKVYTKGGYTLTLNDDCTISARFEPDALTVTRLPVKYDPNAPQPERFLKYLHDLLEDDDLFAVQEYIGYMLVATTKSQRALFLRCDGGGGKSVLLDILSALFGGTSIKGKLEQLATNRFMMAQLENKLAFFDDDLTTSLLEETSLIKSIITANSPMMAERKGKDAYQFRPFARLLVAGNVFPGAAHDRSDGLYRRLLLVECKPRPATRVDDPNLSRKIISEELPGILNWALAGLRVWLANGNKFDESAASAEILQRKQAEDNPVEQFMMDTDWIVFENEGRTATESIVSAFALWCEYNAITPPAARTITTEIAHIAQKKGLSAPYSMFIGSKKKRGYKGIALTQYARNEIDGSIIQPVTIKRRNG